GGGGGEPAARGVAALTDADAVEASRTATGDSAADVLRGARVAATTTCPTAARAPVAAAACAPVASTARGIHPRTRHATRVGARIEAGNRVRQRRAVATEGNEGQAEEQESSQDLFDAEAHGSLVRTLRATLSRPGGRGVPRPVVPARRRNRDIRVASTTQ